MSRSIPCAARHVAAPAVLVLILMTVVSAWAQKPNIADKPGKVEAILMQLERDIGQANIKRDKAFFERVEGDEFIFTDSAGGLTTKAEDVASLDNPPGDIRLVSYEVDLMKSRSIATPRS